MFKDKVKYQIVEVEGPRPALEDGAESVSTLAHHPGFVYLTDKLRLQRSLLETKLKKSRHKDMKEVEFIQSGIAWCGWLDEQIAQSVYRAPAANPLPVTDIEAEAFDRVKAALEVVGQ